jgi:Cof subfamily protein (haloacid dehalogenase superfamily)
MGAIKLVVSDIDGTLITSKGTISPGTRQAIERVIADGVHFGVASGRPTPRVRDVLEGLGISIPIISSNGAVVEDLNTGEVVWSSHLEHVLARQVLEVVTRFDIMGTFIDTAVGWRFRPERAVLPEILLQVVAELEARPWEEDDLLFAEEPVVRKIVVAGEEHVLHELETAVAAMEGIYVTSSWEGNREILLAGVDKANAAKLLAERLGIQPSEVLAIGDHRNDLELVTWAGIGVAMGNAAPELKAAADWITATNDEDGVAVALERFVLG